MQKNGKRWLTTTINVDVESGEIISDSEMIREYYKIGLKQTFDTNSDDKYNFRRITRECRKHGQTRLL